MSLTFAKFVLVAFALKAFASTPPTPESSPVHTQLDAKAICKAQLAKVPHAETFKNIDAICEKAEQLSVCESVKSKPILHYDFPAQDKEKSSKQILVFGIVHGDEEDSATVAVAWLNRLAEI